LDLAENHRQAEAKINLLQETALSSKDPLTFAAIGFAMRREGRYNDAMHAYKAGLYLEPNNIEIRNNIAILHLIRRDTTRAIQELEDILEIDPSLSDIWVNVGTLYALSGSPEKAEKAWLTALQYQVDHQQAKANLFKLYRERER
jgi:Flp pilus assembly protein TadD